MRWWELRRPGQDPRQYSASALLYMSTVNRAIALWWVSHFEPRGHLILSTLVYHEALT